MSGRLLLINDHRLYVETHGPRDGQPVVLLHHGLGAVRSWRRLVPALAAAGYRVIACDRWGFGRSDPRVKYAIPYFQEDVSDLQALLDDLGVEQAALVGHSDGGKVAIYFAAAYPRRVAALVLMAAYAFIESKMETGILAVRAQYEQGSRFRKRLARVHGDQAEAVFWGWFNGWANPANSGWDLRPLLREIACPTPEHARQIAAALPSAELWLVPGAGHMLPQEKPEALNRRLIKFLRDCDGTNGKISVQLNI
jgi:pimeloyl-ACP methyl ester carboxylesterase